MLPLSFEVLAVPHQLSVHLVSHLLRHHLPLAGVVVELIQYGVEGQTRCEPAQQTHIKCGITTTHLFLDRSQMRLQLIHLRKHLRVQNVLRNTKKVRKDDVLTVTWHICFSEDDR